jgi:hypothetical protein
MEERENKEFALPDSSEISCGSSASNPAGRAEILIYTLIISH